jgi:uncharacterized protein
VTLLVDSNVWIAAQDTNDRDHQSCSNLLLTHAGALITPMPVLVESAWFIEDRYGPVREAAFLRLVTEGVITAVELTRNDWQRCIELIETYASLRLGFVDASVIAIAERLELTDIATMNDRDFYAVRPKHCTAFTLLPKNATQ